MPSLTTILAAVLIAVPPLGQAQDLSEPVSPALLPWLHELAFEKIGFEDLRPEIGKLQALRLMVLNDRPDRFPCIVFTVTPKSDGSRWLQWEERTQDKSGSPKKLRFGAVDLPTSDWQRASTILKSAHFHNLPCATRPVSVGHPYIFMFEVFDHGYYKTLYRDSPAASDIDRDLESFNTLATILIRASKLTGLPFTVPENRARENE